MTAHTPTIVWSGLIGQAFLEAFEQLKEEKFLAIAESICTWVLALPRETTAKGSCLSYTGVSQSSVHNSNLLGAGLLARTWKHRKKEEYLAVAREAVLYSCSRQLPDGSWWYGEEEKYHWIDNFHTGYNLDSIKRYTDSTGDTTFRENLEAGYRYFKATFFEASGCPKYYHNRTFPVDIQCAAQAVDTFALFAGEDPDALNMVEAGGDLDDRKYAGSNRLFPLPAVSDPQGDDPLLSLGPGHDVQGAFTSAFGPEANARRPLPRKKWPFRT